MKKSLASSALATLIAAIFYFIFFLLGKEIPAIEKELPFFGLTIPWDIPRVYDIPVVFLLFMAANFFITYLENTSSKNERLHLLINWGLACSLMMGGIIAIRFGLPTGLIVGLSLCFFFGLITNHEFSVVAGLAFGLTFWIITAVKCGLLVGIIPGVIAGLAFGLIALLGFGLRKVQTLKKFGL